jgi:DNA-binding GntR family transcriptional regulator
MRQLNRAVKNALRDNNAKEAALCDSHLHAIFIDRCHNLELMQIIKNLKTNHIRLELHYWQSGTPALPSLEEHEAMIAALEAGNMRAAKNALAANWTRALKRFSRPQNVLTPQGQP